MEGGISSSLGLRPADAFAARLAQAEDARLAVVLGAFVADLHALIDTYAITRSELHGVLLFATEVGHACSDQRQEWALLADVLGLTSGVENQMSRRPVAATPNTLPGPFYRADAPRRRDGESISLDQKGQPLTFRASVVDLDARPVPHAQIEVWQANADGIYENQAPDQQPEFNLRGIFRANALGRATIRTVRPAGYAVPGDGPVGQLMARLAISLIRPAHIHVRITAAGFQPLTTHVFDRSDPALDQDPLFAVHPQLLADFTPAEPGTRGGANAPVPHWCAEHRFTLAPTAPDAAPDTADAQAD
ncbi:dioxygenase family protein [Roseicitreum antarcticum]|uniref:Protocatechuate 3,4-dioxygenase beta subunit n=1 Tax=Roseicitreum antarcticum TaxID=564137 RepID=A0A1H2X7J5_9RHOB|nr:dioxygenase [Roseicitreum antarcticum]SDW88738.1 Protocatechuate 3,4-dioxygenase beta subunit [Roseicitreum antarcticum]